LDKTESPSHKDNLYQVGLNLTCWFWRRFKKKISVFLHNLYCLPLEKGNSLHLIKLEIASPKDDLYKIWLKLVQWLWRKSLQTDRWTDRWTDERRTTGDENSSLELSARVS
jgi:hypothetical protein